MLPFVMEKPAFPTRDTRIDQRNLFLLSERAVSRCRHKGLQGKQVPTDRKSNFQILSVKTNFKSRIALIRLCKEDHVLQLSLYILKLSIFFVTFFVIPVPFCYFTFCFKFYFPTADIIVSHLYILFRKTNTKWYSKTRKKYVARNNVASKIISFFDLCLTRFSRSGKLRM